MSNRCLDMQAFITRLLRTSAFLEGERQKSV